MLDHVRSTEHVTQEDGIVYLSNDAVQLCNSRWVAVSRSNFVVRPLHPWFFFHEPTIEDLSLKPQPKSARSIEFTVQRFQRSRTWAAHCKMQHAFVNRIFNLQIYIPSHPRNLVGIEHGKFPDAKLGRHRLPPKGFLWECSRMCMRDLVGCSLKCL